MATTAFTGSALTGLGNGGATQRYPDAVIALQWNFPNGAIYASGLFGQINMNNGLGAGDGNAQGVGLARHGNAFKWGASLAGRYDFGRVEIGGQGYYGQGINFKVTGPTGFSTDVVLVSSSTSNSFSTPRAPSTSRALWPAICLSISLSTTPSSVIRPFLTTM